jgi:glycosyltransferase involved in cell wall biosynthesis
MLLGRLPHDEAMLHLKAADLFVLNSAGEGMAHSILEAMALGTPVLASRAGGTPDLIEHGVTGWLVAPGDTADLTASIRELLCNPGRAADLAKAARQTAGRFDKDRMVSETASVLRSVL